MNKNNKNIDALFQNEKKASTELSQEKMRNIISKLSTMPAPSDTSSISSLLNLKTIIMVSIPSILAVTILLIAPSDKIVLKDTNVFEPIQIEQDVSIGNSSEHDAVKQQEQSDIKINKGNQAQSNVSQLNQTQNISALDIQVIKGNQDSTKEIVDPFIQKRSIIAPATIRGQVITPQQVINISTISSKTAKRIKRLLYKNLIKDRLISYKGASVEIDLLSNAIIINGKPLDPELYRKYSELTIAVGTGKNKKIKMNSEYIRIGDFTKKEFKGIGVGKFHEETVVKQDKEIDHKRMIEKKDAEMKAETKALTQFVQKLYADQNRIYKKSFFNGNHIKFKELKQVHQKLYALVLDDGLIQSDDEFIVLELGEDQLLLNLEIIDPSKIQAYLRLISQFDLKRKDNRMIKMSKHSIAYGDFQPHSFSGTFCEFL